MALIQFEAFSDVLGKAFTAHIALPETARGPFPVLWLLHGAGDNGSGWLRHTAIERLATRRDLALVAPTAGMSMYEDMAHGQRYFTHIADELPKMLRCLLPLSDKREDNFIAGLSMGGYGALRLALRYPGRYAAAASISGCVEMERGYETFRRQNPSVLEELDNVYGGERELLRGPGSLFGLADRFLKEPQRAPRMYMACGTEDFLFDANEHFFARFGKELPIEYHTEPGNHTWDFWDRYIERILAWLPLDQAEGV